MQKPEKKGVISVRIVLGLTHKKEKIMWMEGERLEDIGIDIDNAIAMTNDLWCIYHRAIEVYRGAKDDTSNDREDG